MEEKLLKKNLDVIVNMKEYGDTAFTQSLADCLFHADTNEFKKLKKAFPEYLERYKNFKP